MAHMSECLTVGPHGFLCTRPDEHGGSYHVAHSDEVRDGKRVVIDRWLIEN